MFQIEDQRLMKDFGSLLDFFGILYELDLILTVSTSLLSFGLFFFKPTFV